MSGTGIKDVVERSGAPIGSLYHYFPGGKTQLVAEALEAHAEKSRTLLGRFFGEGTSPATAVRRLFDSAAEGFDRAGADKGCAIGAVSLDLRAEDDRAREICDADARLPVGVRPQVVVDDQRLGLVRHLEVPVAEQVIVHPLRAEAVPGARLDVEEVDRLVDEIR